LYLNKMNTQLAMDWLLEHGEDADINEPLSADQLRELADEHANFQPDAVSEQRLIDIGFKPADVETALRITNNNYESAAAWLLGDREGLGAGESDEGGEDEGRDDETDIDLSWEGSGSSSNPLLQSILGNANIQSALTNPRILQALRRLIEDPSTAADYANDPEVAPVLLQLRDIIFQQKTTPDNSGGSGGGEDSTIQQQQQ